MSFPISGHLKRIIPLLLFITGEGLMLTLCQNMFGPFISPLIHLLFSVLSAVYLLRMNRVGYIGDNPAPNATPERYSKTATLVAGAVLFLLLWALAAYIFSGRTIDHQDVKSAGSDIIPQVIYLTKRFVSGIYPYSPIPIKELEYTLIPTYLPFQWLPYIPAELLHFDYRFTGLALLSTCLLIYLKKTEVVTPQRKLWIIVGLAPFFFLYIYFARNAAMLQSTVEMLVASFYCWVGFSFFRKSYFAIVLCILFCLLSRYSLVLWLPLLLLVLLMERGFKRAAIFCLLLFTGIALCYGPFLLKDPLIFKKGYDYYTTASITEWKVQSWQPKGAYPPHLQEGLGLAIYVYALFPGTILAKLSVIKLLHLLGSVCITLGLAVYYVLNRKKISIPEFLVGSLKLYLSVFYALIIIPYPYLYLLPMMFNLPVLYSGLRLSAKLPSKINDRQIS